MWLLLLRWRGANVVSPSNPSVAAVATVATVAAAAEKVAGGGGGTECFASSGNGAAAAKEPTCRGRWLRRRWWRLCGRGRHPRPCEPCEGLASCRWCVHERSRGLKRRGPGSSGRAYARGAWRMVG